MIDSLSADRPKTLMTASPAGRSAGSGPALGALHRASPSGRLRENSAPRNFQTGPSKAVVFVAFQWIVRVVPVVALLCAGCQRQQISVYTVPKEEDSTPETTAHGHASRPHPKVDWTLPPGWKATGPGEMSVASFTVSGADGRRAEVTITPLARFEGREVELVNMFRDTLGLDPLSREVAEQQFETVSIGPDSGRLFQVQGTPKSSSGQPSTDDPVLILTAMVHRPDATWFYRISGDVALVQSQKGAFVDFLKSIRIQEGAPQETASTSAAPGADTKLKWEVPPHWTALPPGQMQVAKFAVPPRGGGKAEVSVSRFPGDSGGTLANVNRWRGQLGLPAVQDADASVLSLDPANPDAKLVDLANTQSNRRLLGAIVPRGNDYWFYKLLGDAETVASEKEAFVRFAQSTP